MEHRIMHVPNPIGLICRHNMCPPSQSTVPGIVVWFLSQMSEIKSMIIDNFEIGFLLTKILHKNYPINIFKWLPELSFDTGICRLEISKFNDLNYFQFIYTQMNLLYFVINIYATRIPSFTTYHKTLGQT